MPTSLDVSLNYVGNLILGAWLVSGCLFFVVCFYVVVMCICLFTENNFPKGTINDLSIYLICIRVDLYLFSLSWFFILCLIPTGYLLIIFKILVAASNLDDIIQVPSEHLLDCWTKDQLVQTTDLYGVGSLSPFTDKHKDNHITKLDSFPLPRWENVVDPVGSSNYDIKFDLLKFTGRFPYLLKQVGF